MGDRARQTSNHCLPNRENSNVPTLANLPTTVLTLEGHRGYREHIQTTMSLFLDRFVVLVEVAVEVYR